MATVTVTAAGTLTKISQSMLGVSEPAPRNFGNPANPTNNPTWTNTNWLKSRFHFSFAEYYNPKNTNFGVLRVMNDDLVQPQRGFAKHAHRDAEICTYIIHGKLTHADSMGTEETLSNGAIQFMTAGSGVRHSEHNHSPEPLRFIQMWLTPRQRGLTPNYGSSDGVSSSEQRKNQWHHMVSDVQNQEAITNVKINTDANMYATELDAGKGLTLDIAAGRQAYVLCVDGKTSVLLNGTNVEETCVVEDEDNNGVELEMHDAAEVVGPAKIRFEGSASVGVHLLVVEMKHDVTSDGRSDV